MPPVDYEQGVLPISAQTRRDCIVALASNIMQEAIEQDVSPKELLDIPGAVYQRLLPTGIRAHSPADARWIARVFFSRF